MPAPKRVAPRGQAAPPPAVEDLAPQKKPAKKRSTAKPKNDGYAVRNIRNVIVRITLDETRVELLPRGQRGDLAFVNEDQINDPWFAPNVGMIYEVLTREQARDIIMKQSNNQQVGPSLADQLLNPQGQQYEQAPTVGQSNTEQEITVADVQQGGSTRNQQQTSEVVRHPVEGPPIVSPPGAVGNALTEAQVDALAREAMGEDAGDFLRQNVLVRVEPTQHD